MIKIKPFLKWPGNKFRCLQHIVPLLPAGNRLIEPFVGAGAVFSNTNYPHYLLADANQDLINVFQFLQREKHAFIDYCQRLFTVKNNCPEMYYQIRQEFNQSSDLKHRAALFVYLNRHGFNGLCRYNQQGYFNVPFGQYFKPYFPYHEMVCFSNRCSSYTLITNDFRNTFKLSQPGDIIYCDPPYVPLSSSANFSSYTAKIFGEKEQQQLATLAIECANRNIPVVISNHDTPLTRYYYQAARIISFPVLRTISAKASGRKVVQELIAVFQ